MKQKKAQQLPTVTPKTLTKTLSIKKILVMNAKLANQTRIVKPKRQNISTGKILTSPNLSIYECLPLLHWYAAPLAVTTPNIQLLKNSNS